MNTNKQIYFAVNEYLVNLFLNKYSVHYIVFWNLLSWKNILDFEPVLKFLFKVSILER